MAKQFRQGRVQQEILKEVSDIILRKVRDPRVQGVTITEVDLTGDLQEATVYYTSRESSDQEKEDIQTGLEKASGLIRKELGSRLTTYHTPELHFKRDESIEYGSRIDQLLDQLKRED